MYCSGMFPPPSSLALASASPSAAAAAREESAEPQWTVLVCMPEAQRSHATLVEELRGDGIDIVDRRFTITPAQAAALVQQYASVRRRAVEHRAAPAVSAEADPPEASSVQLPSSLRTEVRFQRGLQSPLRSTTYARRRRPESAGILSHAESPAENGQLLAGILQLAQGHRMQPQPEPAVLPPPGKLGFARTSASASASSSGGGGVRSTRGSGAAAAAAGAMRNNAGAAGANSPLPAASLHTRSRLSAFPHAAGSGAAAAAAPSWLCVPHEEADRVLLADPQVAHLAQGGTVLVLLLRAVNAVERVARLAGPEDPAVARRAAPQSWAARYGVDAARMGVYTPGTPADARAAVQVFFGDVQSLKTPHSAGPDATSSAPFSVTLTITNALTTTTASVPAAPPPLSFHHVLPALRAAVTAQQRVSYYTAAAAAPSPSHTPALTALAPVAGISLYVSNPADGLDASFSAQRAATEMADGHLRSVMTADADSALCVSAAGPQYPQRQKRLDELDELLRDRVPA